MTDICLVYKESLLCGTIKYTEMCILVVDDSIIKPEQTYEVNKSKFWDTLKYAS